MPTRRQDKTDSALRLRPTAPLAPRRPAVIAGGASRRRARSPPPSAEEDLKDETEGCRWRGGEERFETLRGLSSRGSNRRSRGRLPLVACSLAKRKNEEKNEGVYHSDMVRKFVRGVREDPVTSRDRLSTLCRVSFALSKHSFPRKPEGKCNHVRAIKLPRKIIDAPRGSLGAADWKSQRDTDK